MSKQYLFVANWKMNMPHNRTLEYIETNKKELHTLSVQQRIVICPSFIALERLTALITPLNIAVGAQNCSEHERGAYTGEIDALSLYQIGCRYCIIGHSERRLYYHETDEIIAQKMLQLIYNKIIPIICIGEDLNAYKQEKTFTILSHQLRLIFEVLALHGQDIEQCYIAYEPIWAIGTGQKPEPVYLTQTIDWITRHIKAHKLSTRIGILYGGSIDASFARIITTIPSLDGFLIGTASLDFQKLANIVLLG